MYQFCLSDGLNGPKTSTATLSKAPSTGSGKSSALLVFLGDFFIAQSTHDLHQCSTSLKHAGPPISLLEFLKDFVQSKMGMSYMIMYIRQNFVLKHVSGYDRDDTTNRPD